MSKHDTDTSDQHAAKRRWLNAHEEGYHKAMGNRQVQMIAIGGAIGTGLLKHIYRGPHVLRCGG